MKTQNAENSDDEFVLIPSLHSFEQSLRLQQPQPVELNLTQPQHSFSRLSNKSVTMSPLSLALSCGGSALAGAVALFFALQLLQSEQASTVDLASKSNGRASARAVSQVDSGIRNDNASMNEADALSKNLTAGLLVSHPELARLAWTSEAITRVSPSETAYLKTTLIQSQETESKNTLFLLNREISL